MSAAILFWVKLRNDWKEPQAIECDRCGALCASPESYQKHATWHQNLYAEVMTAKWRAEQGQEVNGVNNPIADAELAEVKRLRESATAARLVVQRFYSGRTSVAQMRDCNQTICIGLVDGEEDAEPWPQVNGLANAMALVGYWNAFPGLMKRLEAAERAASGVADLRQRLAKVEADRAKLAWAWNEVQSETASKAADKAKLINASIVCLDSLVWLAQQRREGAAAVWDIVAERSKLVCDAAGETYATEAAKQLREGQ